MQQTQVKLEILNNRRRKEREIGLNLETKKGSLIDNKLCINKSTVGYNQLWINKSTVGYKFVTISIAVLKDPIRNCLALLHQGNVDVVYHCQHRLILLSDVNRLYDSFR